MNMNYTLEQIVAALGALLPGAAWVGRLHQKVNGAEKTLDRHEATLAELRGKLDSHMERTQEIQVTVGRIDEKLDLMVDRYAPPRP